MTEKEILELKNNSLLKLLCEATGVSLDDCIAEMNKQCKEEESLKEQSNQIDDEPTYPLSIAELKQLIYTIQEYYRDSYKFKDIGIDIQGVKLWDKSLCIIESLLEIIFDENIASNIIDQCSYVSKDPDTIVYNIVDFINTRND